jgi:hypothetical protein
MAQRQRRGPKAIIVNDGTDTVVAQFSAAAEMFVPGWDAPPGVAQARVHIEDRVAMKRKKTPIGTLRRS